MKLMEERDKRYDDRYRSQETAINKAEAAQQQYNVGHNDLSRKMETQYKEMLPRQEADGRFAAVVDKIAELREARSEGEGKSQLISFLVAAGGVVIGIIGAGIAIAAVISRWAVPGHP